MPALSFERDIEVSGCARGVRLANEDVELIASTDFGPRILSYRQHEGPNVFGFVDPAQQAKPTPFGEPWHIYGGHRLWHAPEDPVRSYIPDNAPVAAAFDGTTLVLTQPAELVTSFVKELRITLESTGRSVRVEHRITNMSNATARLAIWGLSLMACGGTAIFPNPRFVPFPEGLLPVSRLVLWPYTQLGDARFQFGPRYTRLRQDPHASSPQKLGLLDEEHGWAAYALEHTLFVKRYDPATPATPLVDLGCNVETFTDASGLELETLGPDTSVAPKMMAVHVETWHLFPNVTVPAADEDASSVFSGLHLH